MHEYDAVVVGARWPGRRPRLLMARAGMQVLLLDRVHPGRDTLSTHALMRAGVLQLERWGLLDRITAAGTPPVTGTTFHYADGAEHVALSAPLYAPAADRARPGAAGRGAGGGRRGRARRRRHRGDPRRHRPHHRRAHPDPRRRRARRARCADGRRRRTALRHRPRGRRPPDLAGRHGGRIRLRLLGADHRPGYHWFYRPGGVAGVIPTNDGRVCIWAGLPAADFAARRRDGLDRVFAEVLADVGTVGRAARHGRADRTAARVPRRARPAAQAAGPGWALVGDAGSFKDPLTAHGITDALRDAELLARAAADGSPTAFADYGDTRDALTLPLLRVAEEIAAYRWDTPGDQRAAAGGERGDEAGGHGAAGAGGSSDPTGRRGMNTDWDAHVTRCCSPSPSCRVLRRASPSRPPPARWPRCGSNWPAR